LPCRWSQLAVFADQRLFDPFFVAGEVKSVQALDAQEIAIRTALVPIIAADDLHPSIRTAHPQSCFAAIAAVRADGAYVLHLPRPRFITVRARGERADRADINAHAALFTLKVIFFIRSDNGTDAAILHAQRPHVHSFATDAHAAITQDAPRAIEEHHRRPLLLFLVVLGLHEFGLGSAVRERHVLQFTLAACVADRTIE